MVLKLDRKVALITGGGSGIGRAAALAFAEAGARVVVADVQEKGGEETVQLIRDHFGDALFVKVDVSDSTQVKNLIEKTISSFQRLDCALNNAGIEGKNDLTADCSEDNWDRVMTINLKGIWLCMKYEIPAILKNGGGAIVNMASIAGLVGFQGLPAYCASKGGIIALTRTAALEYAKQGIRINAVCPGVIRTPMVDRVTGGDPKVEAQYIALEPIGRLRTPEEIAHAVVWLCSDEASFVVGHPFVVDGGFVVQ